MTATEASHGELSELGRARAEAVLRAGCLEALRVALVAAGYPVAMIRDRAHTPDRLWVEPKSPSARCASVAVGCGRYEDGWWFVRPWGPRIARVDDLDEVVHEIARHFE